MRIIAGIAKGTPLFVPRDGVRPTSDRTREAVFSSLGEKVAGAAVLDLFAGTGSLGLEAASRGAATVVFVEKARPSLLALERNIAAFRQGRVVECPLQIVRGDVSARLAGLTGTFGLVFADPPYGDAAQRLIEDTRLPGLLRAGGVLVLESAARDPLVAGRDWELCREAVYGDTRVSFFRRQ
jgi:16S rRNA (guanine966-N2)-methyltransferase